MLAPMWVELGRPINHVPKPPSSQTMASDYTGL